MASAINARFDKSVEASVGGVIINTCGWIRGEGCVLCIYAHARVTVHGITVSHGRSLVGRAHGPQVVRERVHFGHLGEHVDKLAGRWAE